MEDKTDKQQAWFNAYIGPARYNATEAARIAGYEFPNVAGAKVRDALSEQVSAHFAANAMGRDEVAARLADIARGLPGEFLVRATIMVGSGEDAEVVDGWKVDVDALKAAGLGHLVKGVKTTANGQNIELHDALAALDKLARFHGMFVDKTEVSGPNGSAVKLDFTPSRSLSEITAEVAAKLAKGEGGAATE